MKNLRIPGLLQVLHEGCACAATDRCFLLANCCTPRREAEAASDLPKKERSPERRRRGKNLSIFPVLPSTLGPRDTQTNRVLGAEGREGRRRFLCRVATSQKGASRKLARGGGPPLFTTATALMSLRPRASLAISESSRGRPPTKK